MAVLKHTLSKRLLSILILTCLAGCSNSPAFTKTKVLARSPIGPCGLWVDYHNLMWSPQPGPDGEEMQLAFVSMPMSASKNVVVIGATKAGLHASVPVGRQGELGGWSPDGKQIVYVSNEVGYLNIYVMNQDGTNTVRISQQQQTASQPSWSPDGSWIRFELSGVLYAAGTDGSNLHRLTANKVAYAQASWSPDGTRIVFIAERGSNTNLYVMNANGTHVKRLTSGAGTDDSPVWSPDGSKILFQSFREGQFGIYVINADGSNETFLAPGINFPSVWSPDGKKIAFISNRDSDQEIYVMDADGSNQTRLTNSPGDDVSPAWSPDGSRIAFVSWRAKAPDIYVMNADGSDVLQLTTNPAKQRCLQWPF